MSRFFSFFFFILKKNVSWFLFLFLNKNSSRSRMSVRWSTQYLFFMDLEWFPNTIPHPSKSISRSYLIIYIQAHIYIQRMFKHGSGIWREERGPYGASTDDVVPLSLKRFVLSFIPFSRIVIVGLIRKKAIPSFLPPQIVGPFLGKYPPPLPIPHSALTDPGH